MSSPSPACTVGGVATPADVAASSTINGALANAQGVVSWFLTCYGTDDLNTKAAVNATLEVNEQSRTFSFTSGIPGSSYVFQSTVGVGSQSQQGYGFDQNNVLQRSYTTTFKVNVPLADGLRVISQNEAFEQDPVSGVLSEINAAIRAEDAVGIENNGTTLAGGPFSTLNLGTGLSATNSGGGVALLVSSAGGWQTLVNYNLATGPTVTIPAVNAGPSYAGGTTFAMAGVSPWSSFNCGHAASTPTLVNGTGLTIVPNQNTNYNAAGSTFTEPGVIIPVSSIITNWGWSTPVRFMIHVSSQNFAVVGDHVDLMMVNAGAAINAATMGQGVRWGDVNGSGNGFTSFVAQATGQVSETDNTVPTNATLILEYPGGLGGQKVNMYSGTGVWPAAGNWNAHDFFDFVACLNGGVGPMVMTPFQQTPTSQQLAICVGGGASTSVSVTIDAIRIDYIPTLP